MRDSGNSKGSAEAIEKVLAGLRDAEAPAGMERRLLEGLEVRASTVEGRSGWRGLMPAWVAMPSKALIFGAALAGVLAAVLVVPAIRWFGHSMAPSNAGVLPGAVVQTAPAITAGVVEASSREQRVEQKISAKTSDASLVPAADSGAAPTEDDVARSEMETASFPAPPMPLTAQERLLLRLAHKVDPVEMAMLDPKFRAMQDAEEKAEFQRFFGQIPVKQTEPKEEGAEQSIPSVADGVEGKQQEQQQIPPGDDSEKGKDNSNQPASPGNGGAPPQDQPIQKQAAPEQASPDQTSPEQSSPEQTKTQQRTGTRTGTGEKE